MHEIYMLYIYSIARYMIYGHICLTMQVCFPEHKISLATFACKYLSQLRAIAGKIFLLARTEC